jgi:hypothetical protein
MQNFFFFFFFFLDTNETRCVRLCSHTPKLNLNIVPNVKFMERADLEWSFRELVGLAWLIAHPQT